MVDTVPESTPPAHTTPECKPKSEEKAEEERRTRAAVNIQVRHNHGEALAELSEGTEALSRPQSATRDEWHVHNARPALD